MPATKTRKCRHCKTFFRSDPRNIRRQKYCSKPECRKASKALSQRRWLQKPENQNYFRGPENVRRVQQWRKANPGYWRRTSCNQKPLQDTLSSQVIENQEISGSLTSNALQDLLSVQPAVLIGLIAHLSGSALQDDIVITACRLRQLGNDILFKGGEVHGTKTPNIPRDGPEGAKTVQLGGSPAGP